MVDIKAKLVLDTAGGAMGGMGATQNPNDPNSPIFHLKKMTDVLEDSVGKMTKGGGTNILSGAMLGSATALIAAILSTGFVMDMFRRQFPWWETFEDIFSSDLFTQMKGILKLMEKYFGGGGGPEELPDGGMSKDPNAPLSYLEIAEGMPSELMKRFKDAPEKVIKDLTSDMTNLQKVAKEGSINDFFVAVGDVVLDFWNLNKNVEDAADSTEAYSNQLMMSLEVAESASGAVQKYTDIVISNTKAMDSEITKIKEKNTVVQQQIKHFRDLAAAMRRAGIRSDVATDLAERGFSITSVRPGVDVKYENGKLQIGESNINLGKGGKVPG